MEVYACGLNAHQQLRICAQGDESQSSQNLQNFQKVAAGRTIRVICILWCATILEIDDQLIFQGYQPSGLTSCKIFKPEPHRDHGLLSVFGDLSGVVGALSHNGEMQEFVTNNERPDELILKTRQGVWLRQEENIIEHVSIAGNGKVAVVSRPSPSAPASLQVLASTKDLFSSTPPNPPAPCFQIDGIKDILSTATSHVLLTSSAPMTMGSPLHPHLLARHLTTETPATEPHFIPFFGGVPIRKICIGGWICAALSQDNDLYVWGGEPGVGEERIPCLPDRGAEEEEMVKLVDIEGMDVLDVGVGDGHMIALTQDGGVWVCGRGEEGQLGLGREVGFIGEWERVGENWKPGEIVAVAAGGWGSWVVVKEARSSE